MPFYFASAMTKNYLTLLLFIVSVVLMQCSKPSDTLFRLHTSNETGIEFNNKIEERDSFNILTHEYIYNGGGVGVADFNNDGLQDLFFAGNQVSNKLYLNKGDFKFEDITESAHVNEAGRWNSGVAIADINNDGWQDIYVCATMNPDSAMRKNMLFINNGVGTDGRPTFTNQAAAYGLEDGGYSVNASFFDYDLDGDLDLYLLINQRMDHLPTNYRPKIADGSALNNDKLYRNNGNNTFSDVTVPSGITLEGFGLGLAVADLNMDGWPDIYVSNDYLSNDVLYINNRDGTFTNKIGEYIGHQSQFSMGSDAADINNDALPDLITLDMLPENNDRKKTTISNKSYLNYVNNERYGYEYQYVRNMLHLNNGLDKGIKFSELGQLSGVHQTEWSWSPLFADFDNDGFKDLIVTNGFPKDVTDKDFGNYRANAGNIAEPRLLVDSIPVIKIPNYVFRNRGDLTFADVTKAWGLDKPCFSNGAAYVDLDSDGDLDYVVNNIADEASVYENTLYTKASGEKRQTNYLRVKLASDKSHQATGAKVILNYGGKVQYQEHTVSRGFLSSVEGTLHFGLGPVATVDTVTVLWPDGNVQRWKNVKANEVLNVVYEKQDTRQQTATGPRYFTEANVVSHTHEEDDKIDFNLQRTLPHKFSQAGPGLCVGDINGDKLEDLITGGSANKPTVVFLQQKDGTFTKDANAFPAKTFEDEGLLLFDVDQDGDLDLYIVSGSVESESPEGYQDRLYLNNGKGKFTTASLPALTASGSCVRAADYDRDGDLDLFVGGRIVPGSYPLAAESYLLRNDKGTFTNVTAEAAPALVKPGLVTDAIWTDFNMDGEIDLIIVGEFMSITPFVNQKGKLVPVKDSGLEKFTGWWNSITAGDFDRDGDTDYVVGNLGQNNAYQVTPSCPLRIVAKDFDGNGSIDPVLGCYMRESWSDSTRKLFPVHFWDELNSQSPKFRRKFTRYRQYSKATLDNLLPEADMKDALVMDANYMESSYVENLGNGKFAIRTLPKLVQVAPVNGMLAYDVNEDGNLDVMMVGNDYGNEVFAGRYDAFTGLILLGDGKGSFRVLPSAASGFYVPGDAKALVRLQSPAGDRFVASQNRKNLTVFSRSATAGQVQFMPQATDSWCTLSFQDGHKERMEFYYGTGYLSQSTRSIRLPAGVQELVVYDSKGTSRKIVPDNRLVQ